LLRGLSLPRPARRCGSETFKASPTHVGAVSESFSDRGSIPRASTENGKRDTGNGKRRCRFPCPVSRFSCLVSRLLFLVDAPLSLRTHTVLAMAAERVYTPSMPPVTPMTAEDLERVHILDKRVELVRGVLVVREPAGLRHGRVAMELARRLANHVDAHGLGRVYAAETGFTLARDPDTVRGPDIAFISRDRVPHPEPVGFPALAPDLVAEVLSPGDRPGAVLAKVADWLSAGTRLVWIVDPERQVARVYREDGTEHILKAEQALEGENVVPGFSCPLGAIL
jgi:Uma2 family endonuclease